MLVIEKTVVREDHGFKTETLKLNDMKELVTNLAALALVIVLICWAGKMDYNEEVIYNMNSGTYEELREKLGDVPESVLVEAYMSDREYWDSVGRMK